MKNTSCLGIWMDHANAHIIAFTTDPIETKNIESEFTHDDKEETVLKGEKKMHHKEQDQQWAYYRKLEDVIANYTDVLLFGPTEAKKELFNMLKANHAFNNISIEMKQTDKMSTNQEHAFVKDHFTQKLQHS